MAEMKAATVTNAGHALFAKALAVGRKVKYTRMAGSETDYTNADREAMESATGIRQEGFVCNTTVRDNGDTIAECPLLNIGLTEGYWLRTALLYARLEDEPDIPEVLFAVAPAEADKADWIPPYNGKTVGGAYLRMTVAFRNTEYFSVQVDPAALVSRDVFDRALAKKVDKIPGAGLGNIAVISLDGGILDYGVKPENLHIDGGVVDTSVETHNANPYAHANLHVDGNVQEARPAQYQDAVLNQHDADPEAHANLIVDGSTLNDYRTVQERVYGIEIYDHDGDPDAHPNVAVDGGQLNKED